MTNPLKKLFFWRNYTTDQHKKWWVKRKVDWKKDYFDTWNHPHRLAICYLLSKCQWKTLLEIGAGGGANLALIAKVFKDKMLSGTDVNTDALEVIRKQFKNIDTRICSADDIFMTDKGVEVILSDMCLIYVGPKKIKKCIKEIRRAASRYVILCEFHHANFWKRWWLRIRSGYHAYDYVKLLREFDFYDIRKYKLSIKEWPDADSTQREFAWIIVAKVPTR